MRIVKIIGGLGNQMFQFALYTALRTHYPQERVLLDLHCFRGYPKHRGFELPTIFNIEYGTASWKDIIQVAYPYPNFQMWRIGSRLLPKRKSMLCEKSNLAIEPTVLTRNTDTYYDGYWQHEIYFHDIREVILNTYTFPTFTDERNKEVASAVSNCNSAAIHVRRGDYLTDPLFRGTGTLAYYQEAIVSMEQKASPELWCVISNDMEWCRQHITPLLNGKPALYVDWNAGAQSYNDMHLMSLCHHNIIANSSFSWWGAWLNRHAEQIVIGPSHWMNIADTCSPMCSNWIQI